MIDAATRPPALPDLDPGRRWGLAFPQLGPVRRLGGRLQQAKPVTDPKIVEMHTTLSAHPFTISLPRSYTIAVERGKEYHAETRQVAVGDQPMR